MSALVFLDTETTSLNPLTRQAWDIAMIRREEDGTEAEFQFFVEVDLTLADEMSLRIGHYWQRHPYGRSQAGERTDPPGADDRQEFGIHAVPRRGEVASPLFAASAVAAVTHNAHIIGAVPDFDTVTLRRLLNEHELVPTWHYHLIDVETLVVGFLALARKKAIQQALSARQDSTAAEVGREESQIIDSHLKLPWDSEDLSLLIGVEPPDREDRHTALGDARWARAVWDKVMLG